MAKIALFLPSLDGGGAERVAITLASGFLKRGYEIDFVLVKATGDLLGLIPPEARLIDLHASRTVTALPKLTTYLANEKPAALIAGIDHVNMIAIWAKLLSHSRSKVSIGNHTHLSSMIRNTPKLQEKIYPLLLQIFHRYANAIIAISQASADDMAKIGKIPRSMIQTIYNPFPILEIIRLSNEPLEHPWFAVGQPPVILAAGRLSAEKDYPTLLKAFALLRSRLPARMIILGEGKERSRLHALAGELGILPDVDLPGFSDHPYAFMSRSRVFVLSSAWEGFGNVLVEALACGTQVVSTDCPGGPAEILEGGRYGRLVPIGDVEALAQAIEAALDVPFPPDILRQRAEDFTVDRAVAQYLKALGLT